MRSFLALHGLTLRVSHSLYNTNLRTHDARSWGRTGYDKGTCSWLEMRARLVYLVLTLRVLMRFISLYGFGSQIAFQ